MRIAFRVDASQRIGSGHLRRCLALAASLRTYGADIVFVVRSHDDVARHVLEGAFESVRWLATPIGNAPAEDVTPPHAAWAGVEALTDAQETVTALGDEAPDWLVVDHYAFDRRWHDAIRANLGCRLMAIDDLADRAITADLLLDTNYDLDHLRKYGGRLASGTRLLAGPAFALLAQAYRDAPRFRWQPSANSIGVFTGGTDPGDTSRHVLRACRQAGFDGAIEIVSTSTSPHLEGLHAACAADDRCTLRIDVPDLSAFFAHHALQVGAGGTATWERCCIGAPTIALVLAKNQFAVVPALDEQEIVRAARLEDHPSSAWAPGLPPLSQVIAELIADPAARRTMSDRARSLVDGRGADRVAALLLRDTLRLRPADISDAGTLHAWRNHPAVRLVSQSQSVIDRADHENWLARVLADEDRWLFVAELGGVPVGSIRFDRVEDTCEVSLYTDPAFHGLGLGGRMLALGEWHARQRHGRILTVTATVLEGNDASARLFVAGSYRGGPRLFSKIIGQ